MSHDHHHDHDPGHGHGHRPAVGGGAEDHRSPLDAGAGRGKILFLDAASGIAGDMTVAAMIDLGVPVAVVVDTVAALGLPGVAVRAHRAMAGAIGATRFEVSFEPTQPERRYAEIDRLLTRAAIGDETRALARRIFRRLAEAEADVHRISVEDVHFHEVGAVDAIVDIVGAAACFAHVGADVVTSPLPIGRGSVECRHGILPLPAPAAVNCLKGLPTYDAGIDFELVTPTGAAIVGAVAATAARWPSMAPERVGWGRGTAELPDRPNALRVVLGVRAEAETTGDARTHVIVEANVDDITGEVAGHALGALLSSGALDAWATPITMKKGRPALTLAALATADGAARVAETMLRETTTLGVRYLPVTSRLERPRRLVDVATEFGTIPVKIGEGAYGSPQVKPEFDACARAALDRGVPVRDVIAAAVAASRRLLDT